jgi:hypothetical protein
MNKEVNSRLNKKFNNLDDSFSKERDSPGEKERVEMKSSMK